MNKVVASFILLFISGQCSADCAETFEQSAKAVSDFNRVLKCLQTLVTSTPPGSLPVGAVVSSMLDPEDFKNAVGDPAQFKANVSKWVLADGSTDISSSRYRDITGEKAPPDLRGMFLRGVNAGRSDGNQDPGGARKPGDFQKDELRSHSHALGYKQWGLANGKGGGDLEGGEPSVKTRETGGAETRPANVAVYYYLKIN